MCWGVGADMDKRYSSDHIITGYMASLREFILILDLSLGLHRGITKTTIQKVGEKRQPRWAMGKPVEGRDTVEGFHLNAAINSPDGPTVSTAGIFHGAVRIGRGMSVHSPFHQHLVTVKLIAALSRQVFSKKSLSFGARAHLHEATLPAESYLCWIDGFIVRMYTQIL